MKQANQKKLETQKEKLKIETQDKLREAQLHSEIVMENMKKEVK